MSATSSLAGPSGLAGLARLVPVLLLALATATPRAAEAQQAVQNGGQAPEGIGAARAQPAASQMRSRVWDDRHGLPQNSVQALAQTPDGYMWLGTQEGVARFDGARFETFDRDSDSTLARPYIWALWADRDNTLWIGTEEAGLVRKRGDAYERFDTADGLPHAWIVDISRSGGTLWVGTMGGVARLVGDRFEAFDTTDGLPTPQVTSIAADGGGGVWVGTYAGLARIDSAGRVHPPVPSSGLPAAPVWDMEREATGTLVVSTPVGVFRGERGAFEPVAGLATTPIGQIAVHRDGTVWGAAGGILYRADPDGTTTTRTLGTVSGPLVTDMMLDREGSLWIGTYGRGVHRVRETLFMPIGEPEGLSSDMVHAVLEDGDGDIWLATGGAGVDHLHDDRVDRYTAQNGALMSNFVITLRESRDGAILAGGNFGFSRIRDGVATLYGPDEGLPSPYQVRDLLEASDGTTWVAMSTGLLKFEPGPRRFYTMADGLSDDFLLTLLEDADGSIWIGARNGLSRMRNDTIESWGVADGLHGSVSMMHRDRDGVMWLVGSPLGLVRMDTVGRFRAYDMADGLCEDVTAGVVTDERGFLWISSNRGIFRVDPADLEAYDAGRLERLPCHLYGREAGMRAREANGAVNPAAVRARDGRLWFPTIQGVVVVDPGRLALDLAPPPVLIEEIVADGDVVESVPPIVPAGTRNLEIHFTALTFVAPELARFRYRLDGFDSDWVEAGDRRIAYYTNLPPGDYRFRVMASNAEGTWNRNAATVDLQLRALWWQTTWFRLLLAGGVVALLALAYKLRVRALQRRQHELEDLVSERTVAEARWRDLFENSTDAVFTTDMDGRLTAFNATAEEMTGWQRDDVLGRHVADLLPEELRGTLVWPPAGGAPTSDMELQARDGRSIHLDLATRILSEGGSAVAVLAVGRDVRERDALESQLRQSQKMEAVGKLAGGVAHDFNNLLTVIQGNGELLLSEFDPADARREDLAQIIEAGHRASALTRQLLAFSRKQIDQPRVFELGALVAGLEAMLRRLLGETVAVAAIPPERPAHVRADPAQIEQVVINLAVNARDAMPDGGTLTIETTLVELDEAAQWAGGPPAGRYALLSVTDAGTGMDEATRARIFEPFFTTKEHGRGTGLGLSTVYGIVQQAGGHVRVDSAPGAGSTFRIYLPESASAPAAAAAGDAAPIPGGSETVLLVEDEDAVRALAARVLQRLGYTVVEARHGRDAIERAESRPDGIDLLVCDVVLPGMGGGRVAEALRTRTPGLPVLFMSGYTDDDVVRGEVRMHGAVFLQKPFTAAQLAAAVREALATTPG